jgi:hypothetical protein
MNPHFLLLNKWFLLVDDYGLDEEPGVLREDLFENGVDGLAEVAVNEVLN